MSKKRSGPKPTSATVEVLAPRAPDWEAVEGVSRGRLSRVEESEIRQGFVPARERAKQIRQRDEDKRKQMPKMGIEVLGSLNLADPALDVQQMASRISDTGTHGRTPARGYCAVVPQHPSLIAYLSRQSDTEERMQQHERAIAQDTCYLTFYHVRQVTGYPARALQHVLDKDLIRYQQPGGFNGKRYFTPAAIEAYITASDHLDVDKDAMRVRLTELVAQRTAPKEKQHKTEETPVEAAS